MSTNASASSVGPLNALAWKNVILYVLPAVVRKLLGVSVPERASSPFADPRSPTLLPECAYGAQWKTEASSVPPAGLVPVQEDEEAAKQKSRPSQV